MWTSCGKVLAPQSEETDICHTRTSCHRLHWDLRFEVNNTLKSWALPKGVPKGNEKRLAVRVDDHPIEYAAFEGAIPKGSYGAGQVKVFDRGTFKMESYEEDKKIVLSISGKKLKGRYCLLHFKPNEKNWLFFKVKDWINCRNCLIPNLS